MPRADGLAVALLAAGGSARFGDADKLMADLGGRPIMRWAAQAGLGIEADWRFLVARAGLAEPGYDLLVNDQADEGMASSLRLAARAAQAAGAGALLVLLADMPLVTPGHLAALLDTASADHAVFSRAPNGVAQPPALFPAAMFPALDAMSGDQGARALTRNACYVDAPADLLSDVDTAADLARCRRLLGV